MKSATGEASKRPYRMGARLSAVEATRARICEATLALWLELSYDELTLDAVAASANTTRQTVLRHFGSKEGLVMAAADWYSQRFDKVVDVQPGDVEAAIDHLLAERELVGDANLRMLELEGRIASIDYGLTQGRAQHRAWIERVFAPQLATVTARSRREQAVDALYAATDVSIWKLLRRDFNRSRPATRAVMLTLVKGVLATFTDATHGGAS